MAYFEFA